MIISIKTAYLFLNWIYIPPFLRICSPPDYIPVSDSNMLHSREKVERSKMVTIDEKEKGGNRNMYFANVKNEISAVKRYKKT